jgi:hypothetical protein
MGDTALILKIKYQNAKLRKLSPLCGDSTILIFNLWFLHSLSAGI